MKRIFTFFTMVLAMAGATANGASAAEATTAPTTVCLKNQIPAVSVTTSTVTLPYQVPYVGGTAVLNDSRLALIEGNEANGPGGLFFAGFLGFGVNISTLYLPDFIGDTPAGLFDPGYSENNVRRGACATVAVVLERHYPVCYANFPNSVRDVSGDELRAMLAKGSVRIPYASMSQKTDFPRGKHWLTCGSGTPTGRVVSTGNGGEVVSDNSVGMSYVNNPKQIGNFTLEIS